MFFDKTMESPVKRLDTFTFGEKDIESWHWFVKKNMPHLINLICFYWAAFGYLILLLLSSIVFNDRTYFNRFKGGGKALLRIINPINW